MYSSNKEINIVLSGGGIKGIAYIGVFDVLKSKGYSIHNIAGVSAGALAGSFASAGYTVDELKRIMYSFDFEKINLRDKSDKLPVVKSFMKFNRSESGQSRNNLRYFLSRKEYGNSEVNLELELPGYRSNFLKNIVTLSKQGCLFDGDYLEEWIYNVLSRRGIKTFGDLKVNTKDSNNAEYKLKMTTVDVNRAKTIVLPDDISYYGIDPDRFEVAKAVRMSTAVPFVFKAVEIKKKEENQIKTHYFVDGGVFDSFPMWLIKYSKNIPKIGFQLTGEGNKKLFSLNTSLKVLKALISAVHDIGIPDITASKAYVAKIDTSKVSFLDFGLDESEKKYLYNSGEEAALRLLNNFEYRLSNVRYLFHWLFRR